ncbi:hypothetical protein ACFWB2_14625 [Streptomyces virginiae]|uniref:hypothetical protein n=1 Tax=Streptomyces TaxID=1883 RepID=UPI000AF9549E|nr:hypothetical protein [Streptomyces sp. MJM1172]
MDYTAMYRQAMADRAYDYARSVLTSARLAWNVGLATPEDIQALAAEVEENPPQ